MTTTQLTPAQHAILAYALEHTDGKIDWFPDNIKGGARKKVLDGLFNRALITTDGTDWFVAAEGYDALGMKRSHVNVEHVSKFEAQLDAIIASAEAAQDETADADAELEAAVAHAEASFKTPVKAPRTRDNSKQAEVIRMLERPEGATIGQICAATGWQAHTVRGTFAGAFKKKLGLTIVSDKPQGGERVYRIATEA